MINIMLY